MLINQIKMNQEIKNYIDDQIKAHIHDGNLSQRIQVSNIIGIFQTVTDATVLTNILASTPSSFIDQIIIDTSTATKKLYVYDITGNVWRSCTIS